jgi:uncharacterized membrane protein YkoI
MRMRSFGIGSLALMFLLASVVCLRGDEQKISLAKVPRPVTEAIKGKFPGVELAKATKETENGKTIFKVSFNYKKHNYEVECQADGTFESINKEIGVKELPEKIAKTLAEKYPEARINLIEEVTMKDTVAYYDVELVSADRKEIELEIAPDGKIQKEKNKDK